jgi:hypothetical protein
MLLLLESCAHIKSPSQQHRAVLYGIGMLLSGMANLMECWVDMSADMSTPREISEISNTYFVLLPVLDTQLLPLPLLDIHCLPSRVWFFWSPAAPQETHAMLQRLHQPTAATVAAEYDNISKLTEFMAAVIASAPRGGAPTIAPPQEQLTAMMQRWCSMAKPLLLLLMN